jgi:hypothetical protein
MMRLLLWIGGVLLAFSAVAQTGAEAPRQPGDYPFTADSLEQPQVPRGKLEGPFEFHSNVFPDTVRRYWIYVPVNYDAQNPPNLLVFQDGQRAINPKGSLRIPTVLDNLIHRGDIPSTLGLFITPGNVSETYPDDLGMSNPDHRAQEYDVLNDRYTQFLIEEMLPQVAKDYRFSADPAKRIIGGTSSGAICAFTVGWHRPDAFGNVISFIGSYTSIGYQPATTDQPLQPGGDLYPGLIRKSAIRPLRIFLQGGSNDIDNEHGNWFLANQQMQLALQWANTHADEQGSTGPRYDVRHVWGDGGHSDQHGGSLMPEVLRWMWRDQ